MHASPLYSLQASILSRAGATPPVLGSVLRQYLTCHTKKTHARDKKARELGQEDKGDLATPRPRSWPPSSTLTPTLWLLVFLSWESSSHPTAG